MINIIMCTYNGEKYIRQQLQSIVDSTVTDWKILISDDQSTDSTIQIAREFQKQYPDKIQIQVNNTKKGAIINFLSGIYQVGTRMEKDDFIMLWSESPSSSSFSFISSTKPSWEPATISARAKQASAPELRIQP